MVAPMTLCLELLAIACLLATAVGREVNQFPDGFLLGAATASYQIEGAWIEEGKGESIWDHMLHEHPEYGNNGDNGDVACDSYHKYAEDVQALKDLGVTKVYRFSISWPRILPNGDLDVINQPGIDYYNNIINLLLDNDIQPLVTMFHWDLPQALQYICGWPNPILADYFLEYATVLFDNFGDRLGLYANPIFVDGDYPAVVRERVDNNSRAEGRPRLRLPSFTEEEKRMINGSFFGFNSYATLMVSSQEYGISPSMQHDTGVFRMSNYTYPVSAAFWLTVVPWGFRKIINWVSTRYPNYPIIVTENGYAEYGDLDDQERISYYGQYLAEMLKAINEDGANVFGYTAWSLLDNLEWNSGYSVKFGMYHVAFNSTERTRTPKASASFLAGIYRNMSVPEEYFQ
ncbi:lactase-like protein [Schistocerca serialis cubense]|uniref:lactase-like protein n=1 Tax=Schistocerca serialis cubense TaxID=2023355 RepID=UPI00214EA80F|nr:lactase-like protein [Schistocerca serialis cubense]